VGSKLQWSVFPRVCTWAKLHDKKAGKNFFLFNAHLDYESEKQASANTQHLYGVARVSQMQIILRKIKEISHLSDPVFITGDWNTDFYPNDPLQRLMAEQWTLTEISEKVRGPRSHDVTYTGFGAEKWEGNWKPNRIDWIYMHTPQDSHLRVTKHDVIETPKGKGDNGLDTRPSDHSPIVVDFKWE